MDDTTLRAAYEAACARLTGIAQTNIWGASPETIASLSASAAIAATEMRRLTDEMHNRGLLGDPLANTVAPTPYRGPRNDSGLLSSWSDYDRDDLGLLSSWLD